MTTSVATLTSRTVPADPGIDLATVAGSDGVLWERDGVGFAGRGQAARIAVRPGELRSAAAEVAEVLHAIETGGGPGPVAFGALPFSPTGRGELVVPEVLVRRGADGSCWLTLTGTGGLPPSVEAVLDAAPPGQTEELADHFSVGAALPPARWFDAVQHALGAISSHRLDKVVLAREVVVSANHRLSAVAVVRRLRATYPSCMIFAAPGFVGASPELLVSRAGRRVRSHPLAGTARSGDAVLLGAAKEEREHRMVVDAVTAALAPHCTELHVPASPSLVDVGHLVHLGTLIEGTLRHPAPSALALVAAIHPTPAVAGSPTPAALKFIADEEGFDRGRYAGPVGWVDADGDGEWAVAIRSAELDGYRARLFAGAGLVAGSDAAAELAETQLKLQPLLDAILRP